MRDMKCVPPPCAAPSVATFRGEPQHIGIEYSEAIDIALHGVTAHQLLTDANSEHR